MTLVINQLADLFSNLEYCETASVTPTLELAKLALITSRDEEEDEVDKGGTDSSNDTDATLVDDGPSRTTLGPSSLSDSPGQSSSSVLGKRPRDLDRQPSEMEVDSPLSQSPKERDGFVLVSAPDDAHPPEVASPSTDATKLEASSSKIHVTDKDGDSKMSSSVTSKPPLPSRKRVEQSDSTMMFGECYTA